VSPFGYDFLLRDFSAVSYQVSVGALKANLWRAYPVPTRVYLEFVEIALYSFILDSI
jgi:hypothetical protein